jgi:hypothetical protein
MDEKEHATFQAALGRIEALESQVRALAQSLVLLRSLRSDDLLLLLGQERAGGAADAQALRDAMYQFRAAVETAREARDKGGAEALLER